MEDLSKQKPMCSRPDAMRCHRCHHNRRCRRRRPQPRCTLTALVLMLLVLNECYGDQIKRDLDDINSSVTRQVQFKKHYQRQAFNFNVTLHDNRLLRDETIKSDEAAAATAVVAVEASSIRTAHVVTNKSERRVERNGQTTAFAVKTTANHRFDAKRDPHRKAYQSRNINGNALATDRQRLEHEFKEASDVSSDGGGNRDRNPFHRPLARVPNSKPKITSKLSDAPSYSNVRTTTYLSYNLVRDNVQRTERFMPTSYQRSQQSNRTQIKQTSTNYVYKTYYRPMQQRNNCNKCRIIPGAPIRHKSYLPTRVQYHGMY